MTSFNHLINVSIESEYIAEQKENNESNFIFGYTITITNNSDKDIRLLSRYWLITDADGQSSKVEGDGVIGMQPLIKAHDSFTYTSGCILKTPVGTMQGHYNMVDDKQIAFVAQIPVFRLNQPNIMH